VLINYLDRSLEMQAKKRLIALSFIVLGITSFSLPYLSQQLSGSSEFYSLRFPASADEEAVLEDADAAALDAPAPEILEPTAADLEKDAPIEELVIDGTELDNLPAVPVVSLIKGDIDALELRITKIEDQFSAEKLEQYSQSVVSFDSEKEELLKMRVEAVESETSRLRKNRKDSDYVFSDVRIEKAHKELDKFTAYQEEHKKIIEEQGALEFISAETKEELRKIREELKELLLTAEESDREQILALYKKTEGLNKIKIEAAEGVDLDALSVQFESALVILEEQVEMIDGVEKTSSLERKLDRVEDLVSSALCRDKHAAKSVTPNSFRSFFSPLLAARGLLDSNYDISSILGLGQSAPSFTLQPDYQAQLAMLKMVDFMGLGQFNNGGEYAGPASAPLDYGQFIGTHFQQSRSDRFTVLGNNNTIVMGSPWGQQAPTNPAAINNEPFGFASFSNGVTSTTQTSPSSATVSPIIGRGFASNGPINAPQAPQGFNTNGPGSVNFGNRGRI
jgi:nucleoside-triphosphatase THEP1